MSFNLVQFDMNCLSCSSCKVFTSEGFTSSQMAETVGCKVVQYANAEEVFNPSSFTCFFFCLFLDHVPTVYTTVTVHTSFVSLICFISFCFLLCHALFSYSHSFPSSTVTGYLSPFICCWVFCFWLL